MRTNPLDSINDQPTEFSAQNAKDSNTFTVREAKLSSETKATTNCQAGIATKKPLSQRKIDHTTTTLDANLNPEEQVISDAIQKLRNLHPTLYSTASLILWGKNISDKGVATLVRIFKENNSPRAWYLGENQISDAGVDELAELFSNTNNLCKLDLTGNPIHDEGAETLASGLLTNITLQSLALLRTHISLRGLAAFVEPLLKNNRTLLNFKISSDTINADDKIMTEIEGLVCRNLSANWCLKELKSYLLNSPAIDYLTKGKQLCSIPDFCEVIRLLENSLEKLNLEIDCLRNERNDIVNSEKFAKPKREKINNAKESPFLDIDVSRDGACLFHAIALGLQLNENAELSPLELRSAAASHLQNNCELHAGRITAQLTDLFNQNRTIQDPDNRFHGIPVSFKTKLEEKLSAGLKTEQNYVNSEEGINDYINHMFNPTTWGGEIELGVLAKLLQLQFLIYDGKEAIEPRRPFIGADEAPKIHLLFEDNHYGLRIPKESFCCENSPKTAKNKLGTFTEICQEFSRTDYNSVSKQTRATMVDNLLEKRQEIVRYSKEVIQALETVFTDFGEEASLLNEYGKELVENIKDSLRKLENGLATAFEGNIGFIAVQHGKGYYGESDCLTNHQKLRIVDDIYEMWKEIFGLECPAWLLSAKESGGLNIILSSLIKGGVPTVPPPPVNELFTSLCNVREELRAWQKIIFANVDVSGVSMPTEEHF